MTGYQNNRMKSTPIAMRWENPESIAHPQNFMQPVRIDLAEDRVVDHDRRRQTTGSHTTHNPQRELLVMGSLAHSDPEDFGEFLEDFASSPDIASGSQTDPDRVFTTGFVGEEGIETSDSIDLGERDIHPLGNELLDM